MNFFPRLANIISPYSDQNMMLHVNFNEREATITPSTNSHAADTDLCCLFLTGIDETPEALELIKETLNNLRVDLNGGDILLNLFVLARKDTLDKINKRNSEKEAAQKRIKGYKNKEVQNIKYYDSYLGYNYIDSTSTKVLRITLKDLYKARRNRIIELHKLSKGNIWHKDHPSNDSWSDSRMDYISSMGLGYLYDNNYLFRERIKQDDSSGEYLLVPLSRINEDYQRCKIHTIEVELAYLNRNIKIIKKVLRERPKEGKDEQGKHTTEA